MCHNNLRGFEADMVSKIVNDVETQLELQPITSEIIEGLSGNASKSDIRARGVWRTGQNAFFILGRQIITLHYAFTLQQKVF